MSLFDLDNRVAVVTGGNGGIGLAIAKALAAEGCAVSIWGRNEEKNAQAEAAIKSRGGRVMAIACDVSDRHQAGQATLQTLEHFGRIDGCFANAGIGGGGRAAFVDRTAEEWRQMFASIWTAFFIRFSRSSGIWSSGPPVATASAA